MTKTCTHDIVIHYRNTTLTTRQKPPSKAPICFATNALVAVWWKRSAQWARFSESMRRSHGNKKHSNFSERKVRGMVIVKGREGDL